MTQRITAVELLESFPLHTYLLQAENRLCHQMRIIENPDDYTAEPHSFLTCYFISPQISIISTKITGMEGNINSFWYSCSDFRVNTLKGRRRINTENEKKT